jgi:hypothetical protein
LQLPRDRLLERKTTFQRLRLLAGPGTDLRLLRAGGEIGIGLGVGHGRHRSADADLPAQRLPVKQQRRFGICGKFAAFGARDVAVEHESLCVIAFHQHHAHVWQALGIGCGEGHGVGIVGFRRDGFREPSREQHEGLRSFREITGR